MRRAPTTPRGTAGSTSPPRRALPCAPPTTASSASPVRVAGTLHVTIAHAGDLRTSYSFLSSVGVRIGQPVTRGDVVGLTGGVGTDHDGRRAAPRPAHRRPVRRPDAPVPRPRPHRARAPGARGRPCRDPVVPGRRAARVAVVTAPADARCRRRPWRDRVRRLVRHGCPAARRRHRRGLRPGHVGGRRRRRRGRRRSAIPGRHHRPRVRGVGGAAHDGGDDDLLHARAVVGAGGRPGPDPGRDAGARRRHHRATFRRHRHRRLQRRRVRCRRHRWVRAPRDGRRRDRQRREGVGPRADGRARRRRRSGTTSTRARSATTRTPPTAARTPRPTPTVRSRSTPSDSRSSSAPCSASSPAARSTSSPTRRVGSSSTSSCRMCIDAGDRTLPPLGNVVTLSSPHEGAPLADRRTADPRARRSGKRHARRDRGGLDVPAAEQPRGAGAGRGLAADRPPVGPGSPGTLRLDHDRRHRGRRRAGHQHLGAGRHRRPWPRSNSLSEHSAIVRAPDALRARAGRARGQTATVRQPPHRAAQRGGPGGHQPGVAQFGDGAAAILGGAG